MTGIVHLQLMLIACFAASNMLPTASFSSVLWLQFMAFQQSFLFESLFGPQLESGLVKSSSVRSTEWDPSCKPSELIPVYRI